MSSAILQKRSCQFVSTSIGFYHFLAQSANKTFSPPIHSFSNKCLQRRNVYNLQQHTWSQHSFTFTYVTHLCHHIRTVGASNKTKTKYLRDKPNTVHLCSIGNMDIPTKQRQRFETNPTLYISLPHQDHEDSNKTKTKDLRQAQTLYMHVDCLRLTHQCNRKSNLKNDQ